MLNALNPVPDLDLLLSPDDEAEFVGQYDWTTPTGRMEVSHLFIVLHRRHGLWTHAYRVVSDRRPGHLLIYVVRVTEGDRRGQLREWLLGQSICQNKQSSTAAQRKPSNRKCQPVGKVD